MSENDPKELVKRLTIIWAAMLAFPVGVGGYLSWQVGEWQATDMPPAAIWILIGFALAELPLAFVLPRGILNRGDAAPEYLIQTASIVRFAIIEGSVLTLVIAFFITGRAIALGVASLPLAALLAQKPSLDETRRLIRSLEARKAP